MIAYDGTSGKVWFGKNGTWINGGDPAAGTNATYDGTSTMAADDFIVGISSIGSSASLTLEATLLSYGTEVTYTPPTGFDTLDDPAGPQSGNISFSLQPLDVVATGSNGDYSGDIAIYLQPLGVSSTIGSGHINISFQPLSFFAYAPLNEYKLEIALQPLGVDILVGSKDISISLQPLTITIEADANAPAYLNASLQPLSIAATADASEYGFVNISLKPLAVDITGIKGEVADISFSLKALNVSASEKAEEEDDPFISMTMQALTVRAKATAPTGLPQALRYSRRQLR
jgi:hypothetical protein